MISYKFLLDLDTWMSYVFSRRFPNALFDETKVAPEVVSIPSTHSLCPFGSMWMDFGVPKFETFSER